MPESSFSQFAEALEALVCECLSALDLDECLCFSDRKPICHHSVHGWCGVYPDCKGVFINFQGTDSVPIGPNGGGPWITEALFEIGVALCLPDEERKDQTRLYAECLEYMAEEVWHCLAAQTCESCTPSRPIRRISGINCRSDGFTISVAIKA